MLWLVLGIVVIAALHGWSWDTIFPLLLLALLLASAIKKAAACSGQVRTGFRRAMHQVSHHLLQKCLGLMGGIHNDVICAQRHTCVRPQH